MNSTELRASYIASDVDSRVVVGAKRRSERGRGEKENGESVGVGRSERRRLGRAPSTLIGFYS